MKQEEPKAPKSLAAEEPPALDETKDFTYHKQYDGIVAVQAGNWIYYTGKRTNWPARVKADGRGQQE